MHWLSPWPGVSEAENFARAVEIVKLQTILTEYEKQKLY